MNRLILRIFSKQFTWAIWATLWSFMSFGNQHTAALNLTFTRGNTRFFAFVCFADIFWRRSQDFESGVIYTLQNKNSWRIFEILPTSHLDGYVIKLKLIADCTLKTVVLERKHQSNAPNAYESQDTLRSFTLFIIVKTITKLNLGHHVKFEIEVAVVIHGLQTTQNFVISRCCFMEDG